MALFQQYSTEVPFKVWGFVPGPPVDNGALVFKCTRNGRFPEPGDCQIFHECDDTGNHAEYRCPDNMVFNPEIGLCDLRHNVPQCMIQPSPSPPARSRYDVQKSGPANDNGNFFIDF